MSEDEVLQIKITLEGISPRVWRRFHIENKMTFHQLHQVIQEVMGWTNSHLYSFTVDGQEYQDDREDDLHDFDGDGLLPSRENTIGFLSLKQRFSYTYDFGDCWEHLLVVEKVLPRDPLASYPFCL
ncbi:MAG TPA: plasmid pRiA4b ORF-3 family protein, partial [Candidatus Hodarchaeales archaeon]|nr:plasmid pRiA4b ORF-3 family protein [Candidatus Hodarchaeales archaeon]